jgi:F-type H+-transporting ATPase subunit b
MKKFPFKLVALMFAAIIISAVFTHGVMIAHAAEAVAEGAKAEADTGVLGMFGLNWKLFLAQLVNFGIVLFVLWKWVFKPVTKGLSDRTAKIEGSLQEAERIAKDRETFESWKQGEISTVRTEASAIITQAKQAAETLKAETLKITTEEQARLIEQTKERMAQEKTAMIESAKSELADIVVQATSTILKAKIDPAKDKQLIADALKQAQH